MDSNTGRVAPVEPTHTDSNFQRRWQGEPVVDAEPERNCERRLDPILIGNPPDRYTFRSTGRYWIDPESARSSAGWFICYVECVGPKADGSFSIVNVPGGYYWFQFANNAVWTSSSTIDFGADISGRRLATNSTSQTTTFHFTVDGLNPVSAAISFRLLYGPGQSIQYRVFDHVPRRLDCHGRDVL